MAQVSKRQQLALLVRARARVGALDEENAGLIEQAEAERAWCWPASRSGDVHMA